MEVMAYCRLRFHEGQGRGHIGIDSVHGHDRSWSAVETSPTARRPRRIERIGKSRKRVLRARVGDVGGVGRSLVGCLQPLAAEDEIIKESAAAANHEFAAPRLPGESETGREIVQRRAAIGEHASVTPNDSGNAKRRQRTRVIF